MMNVQYLEEYKNINKIYFYSIMNPLDKSIITLDRPIVVTSTQQIKYYTYYVSQLIPHSEATLCINLFTSENLNIKCIYARLINEDYEQWGSDDGYLDDFVKKYLMENCQLSFGIAPVVSISEPTPEPTAEPTAEPTPEPTPENV